MIVVSVWPMLLVSALKADLQSAIRPIPHSADLPPPLFTSLPELVDEPVSSTSEGSSLEDDCYNPLADKSPILITPPFLNDSVRDLNLQNFLGPGYNTITFLLQTQHISGTGKEKKIWYNIFLWRKHLCVVTMLPVFFKQWAVCMTQQNGDYLLTVQKPA